ncbi:hypothetical protein, partial [Comamonas thiooxydans]|uniref:hypothetical protein n=1 Tax=Comamonas thiooxydans TaxID=363952 RepID=UPI001A9442EC
ASNLIYATTPAPIKHIALVFIAVLPGANLFKITCRLFVDPEKPLNFPIAICQGEPQQRTNNDSARGIELRGQLVDRIASARRDRNIKADMLGTMLCDPCSVTGNDLRFISGHTQPPCSPDQAL